jgi:hypothetical protein
MSKEELDEKIVELTQRHWKNTGRALLLASLGQTLTKNGFSLRAILSGESLTAYIEARLDDSVTILQSPSDALVLGAVPKAAWPDNSIQLADLFKKDDPGLQGGIANEIWRAFSIPIPRDHVRILLVEPVPTYTDLPSDDPSLPSNKNNVVPPSLVVPFDPYATVSRRKQILKNIHGWLKERQTTPGAIRVPTEPARARHESHGSLFDLLLQSLDKDDLSRLNMPLDVAAKLMSIRAPK